MDRKTRRTRHLVLAAALAIAAPAALTYAQQQDAGAPQEIQPPAQIAISPGKVEVDLNAGPSVQSLKVMNFGDRDIDVDVTVVPWELDESNRVRVLEPTERSLDQWLIFNPRTFTLRARSEQTVRFSIRPRTQPADGEHRAMIYFRERPLPTGEGRVQVIFNLGVAVYAYAGEVQRQGRIHDIQVASDPSLLGAAFDIESVGNAHVRMQGQYAVWPVTGFPGVQAIERLRLGDDEFRLPEPILMAGWLPNTPVLGGTRRQIYLAELHQLPAGRYVLTVDGDMGDDSFRDAIEFSVPAPAPPPTDDQGDLGVPPPTNIPEAAPPSNGSGAGQPPGTAGSREGATTGGGAPRR